jgi:hypothetical protein
MVHISHPDDLRKHDVCGVPLLPPKVGESGHTSQQLGKPNVQIYPIGARVPHNRQWPLSAPNGGYLESFVYRAW